MGSAPRVFLSHASEDKERFVLQFAEALRQHGVDVWLDKWEILPGDSLVDKLFEEGLKGAVAVIVVISSSSANKPWVKEELNAAIVNRITKQTKIIPVVIDDCKVPEALSSTVWERIESLGEFTSSLQRIIMAIFGQREKPALGTPPRYVIESTNKIPGLTTADVQVFRAIYDEAIATYNPIIMIDTIAEKLTHYELTPEILFDSIEIIIEQHYAVTERVSSAPPRGIFYVQPTDYGFLQYADAFLPEFQQWMHTAAMQIINYNLRHNQALASAVQIPQFVMDQILKYFSAQSWINLASQTINGGMYILSVSPSLRRHFQQ